MDRDELAAWLRLSLTYELGNAGARKLLAAFGLPQAVFDQSDAALSQLLSLQQLQAMRREPEKLAALLDSTWQWLSQADPAATRRVVALGDPAYPPSLLDIEDPPLVLYLMGQLPASWPAAVAMVGSRNPTPPGLENARLFSRSFAQSGLTVVSGLALGVDGASHEGALEGAAPGQLATIAVVGTGLDRVYPRQHLELARRIAGAGLLVSEYPLGTPPLAQNFPQRNRLIAALSQGTLVVEAALKSGSLITARQAAEQGREVFAIPGSIHSTQSRGCHLLIKQGAKLVESAQDVLEELPTLTRHRRTAASPAAAGHDSQHRQDEDAFGESGLLAALGFDPVSLDALVARTGMSAADLLAGLLELELAGHVARLPGGLFQRISSA